jgi:16S rRNA (uracil1498-N3)-methyltransferase
MKHIPRFFVKCKLQEECIISLDKSQMHHAANVLRLKVGDGVVAFNEACGEWNCVIISLKKCELKCLELLRMDDGMGKNVHILACSPINPSRMSILLEKVTELGVSEIVPVISQYTQYRKFSHQKAEQIIIGACEQSSRISLPKLAMPVKLEEFLGNYSYNCRLIVCDEKSTDVPSFSTLNFINDKCVFLVGPEGGFSNHERILFDKYNFVTKISLGKNILRSETAAIAMASILSIGGSLSQPHEGLFAK